MTGIKSNNGCHWGWFVLLGVLSVACKDDRNCLDDRTCDPFSEEPLADGGTEDPTGMAGGSSENDAGSSQTSPSNGNEADAGDTGANDAGNDATSMDSDAECMDGDSRSCSEGGFRGACAAGRQDCSEGEWGPCSVQPADVDTCEPGNDADCNGIANEGCGCADGATAACSITGAMGNCARGEQVCDEDGQLGPCSVQPAEEDSCDDPGDDANCNGIPNDTCECEDGDTQPCGPDTDDGVCEFGESTCVDGSWSECVGEVEPKARNCSSSSDNDCDGEPDNAIDSLCRCEVGDTRACEEHPGLDGEGRCQAGEQTCLAGADGTTSYWGDCLGSVGPASADSCSTRGDDSDCDGEPNSGCDCVAGDTEDCETVYDSEGVCSSIVLTCNNAGQWPSDSACNPVSVELCNDDDQDEDCDGDPDNDCECFNDEDRACGECGAGTETCVDGEWDDCEDETTLRMSDYSALHGPDMRCIPESTINVGAADLENDFTNSAGPPFPSTHPAFWMDETEVTVAQFQEFASDEGLTPGELGEYDEPYFGQGGDCNFGTVGRLNHPMNCVNHAAAVAYCSYAGKELPSEVTWEHAARAPDGRAYPWGSQASAYGTGSSRVNGNGSGDGYSATAPVKSFPSGESEYGLFDMSGNVGEFTAATVGCPYADDGTGIDTSAPQCTTSSSPIRGGRYPDNFEDAYRSAWREIQPLYPNDLTSIGFRCSLDAGP